MMQAGRWGRCPSCGWIALVLLLSACGAAAPGEDRETSPSPPPLAGVFEQEGVEGAFVLKNLESAETVRHAPELCATGFLPASTFKIFNAMAALETGVVDGEDTVFPWDGVERGRGWDGDQDLATAFRRSTVWYFIELARRMGLRQLGALMERESYGNAATGGGEPFWLAGELRISPDQQVEFVGRLARRELGFPERAMRIVTDLMLLEEGEGYTLRGKTGWARTPTGAHGWLVGWVERGEARYAFATLVTSNDHEFDMVGVRKRITRELLTRLEVLPTS